jgi:glutamate synthase (NADPH/NADH) large chain
VTPKPGVAIHHAENQNHGLESALDHDLIAASLPSIENGQPVRLERSVRNVDRTVGAMLSGEVARRHGHAGLPEDTISVAFTGTAGQSFGAFLARGVSIELTGDANDYVGKGLSGGRIVVKPPRGLTRDPAQNIIVGNTVLYGAIAGEAYFHGVAGERFAVRNSGAIAVVEGTGDHGCEYMTGGVVVVLGGTGRNFAAGMSGGIAYVFDADGSFEKRCNLAMVKLEKIAAAEGGDSPDSVSSEGPRQRSVSVADAGMGDLLRFDAERLRILVERHLLHTGSAAAKALLDDWAAALGKFVKVMPTDYAKALADLKVSAAASVAAE